MIVGQIALGGVTRLTGSGLSITEWKPLVGAVPPLSEAAWAAEFAKYQQIPQFKVVNAHFGLADFKRIYFWEWLHRLWGRLLAASFFIPLVFLWRRGQLAGLGKPLLLIGALGLLQGFVGWFMVASGLKDLTYVSHFRLAAHFLAALILLAAVYWVALSQLVRPSQRRVAQGDAKLAWWLVAGLTLQLVYGAFMAGLRAAPAAPSWPSINGMFLPRGVFGSAADLVNSPLAIHFIHRNLGYALGLAVLAYWVRLLRTPAPGHWRWTRHAPGNAVLLQLGLGIATVLKAGDEGLFIALATAHQLGAVALLLSLVTVAYLSLDRAPQVAGAAPRASSTSDRLPARA